MEAAEASIGWCGGNARLVLRFCLLTVAKQTCSVGLREGLSGVGASSAPVPAPPPVEFVGSKFFNRVRQLRQVPRRAPLPERLPVLLKKSVNGLISPHRAQRLEPVIVFLLSDCCLASSL